MVALKNSSNLNRKPTIKDIAKKLNVSHVAVSRALRDAPDISEELKVKVRQVADEIGYVANAYARSLSSKNYERNIGMIVPSIGVETAYNDAFKAISEVAASKNHSMLLGVSERDKHLEEMYCQSMCENRVGALIVSPVSSEISAIKKICKGIVPLIFLGGKIGRDESHYVMMNYKTSGRKAVEYLYELGHRKIALFLYFPENNTIKQKREGYLEAINERGLEPIIYSNGDASDTYEAGYELSKKLLYEKNMPSAIWCASDLMAMGVIDCLKNNNIKIPEDVSVMGHDNLYFSHFRAYDLTTFNVPKREMGEAAVNIALFLMGQLDQEISTQIIFEPKFFERGSTGRRKDSSSL